MRLSRGHPHPALRGAVGSYADFEERTGSPRESGEAPGGAIVVIVDLDAGWTVEGDRFGSSAGGLYVRPVRVRHEGSSRGVQRAWALLRATGGRIRIDALADALGCSRRHLVNRFADDVGVSPKAAARLVRFEAARARLGSVPLARLAAEHGFADQAHLAREFRALGGSPPSTFPSVQDSDGAPP